MKVKELLAIGLSMALLLSACGGDDNNTAAEDQAIATPIATLDATGAVDTAATDTATVEATATEAEATPTVEVMAEENLTDTAALTDTEMMTEAAATGNQTDTGVIAEVATVTDTVVVTDTAIVTKMVLMTDTVLVTDTAVVTDTVLVTQTVPLTSAESVEGAGIVTNTADMTGTGTVTAAEVLIVPAPTVAATTPETETVVVTDTIIVTDTKVVTDSMNMTGTTGMTGTTDTTGMTDTTGVVVAPSLGSEAAVETYGVVRVSELMDFNVVNLADEDLGDVDDAVVTMPNGCIQYVLVSSGGILGLGEDQFLVPWRAVALDLRDGRLVLNVDQSLFDTAPIFDANNMPDMNTSDWDADLTGFWDGIDITPPATAAPAGEVPVTATQDLTDSLNTGVTDTNAAVPGALDTGAVGMQDQAAILVQANPCDMSMTGTQMMTGTTTMTDTTAMTDTAATGVANVAGNGMTGAVRLSELMDFGVRNPAGEDLGSLEDIVLDWQHSRLAYTVLSFGGFLGIGDKWFAIPFDAVTIDPVNRNFIFDVTQERLDQAPGFDPNQLPDTTNPNWDTDIRDFWGLNNGL